MKVFARGWVEDAAFLLHCRSRQRTRRRCWRGCERRCDDGIVGEDGSWRGREMDGRVQSSMGA
jgi:hypothetical protein